MSLLGRFFGIWEHYDDELPEEITPGPPLAANEQALLDEALRNCNSYFHPEDDDYRYVKEKTSQAIREWLSVDMEGAVPVPPELADHWTLSQLMVSGWVGDYITRGAMIRTAKEGYPVPPLSLYPPIDGAKEHEKVIAAIKEYWEKLEEGRREIQEENNLMVSVQRLTELANTPVDYEQIHDGASEGLPPASVYVEFAAQLRQENLDESIVFDMVTELSKIVQQSQAVFPQLTPSLAKLLEARVLLSYYKGQQNKAAQANLARNEQYKHQQQEHDKVMVQWDQLQSADALQTISEQVSSLNATTQHEAQDVSTMKWLHIIDGLFGH